MKQSGFGALMQKKEILLHLAFIGAMYQYGLGVQQDNEEAVKWFKLSAEQGIALAQYNLGKAYYHGLGIQKDRQEAIKRYRLAADQVIALTRQNMDQKYHRDSLDAYIRKDYQEAYAIWLFLVAQRTKRGDANGQYKFGEKYSLGFPRNLHYGKEAVKLWSIDAEKGNGAALGLLVSMYHHGTGVPMDNKEALKWIRLAAEQRIAAGQRSLGYMYERGLEVSQDYSEAAKWYQLSAEQGNTFSSSRLYELAKKNIPQAVQFLINNAEQGDSLAQSYLGRMYADGEGIAQDNIQAHKWFSISLTGSYKNGREFKNNVEKQMTPVQIAEAQKLEREWMKGHQKN